MKSNYIISSRTSTIFLVAHLPRHIVIFKKKLYAKSRNHELSLTSTVYPQHSLGAQQPSKELPTNAILLYLSFTFCLIISSFTPNVYKRNYLRCQESLGKVSVVMALEILIPLCCTTTPVRYLKFRKTMKGFSSKTLAKRLKELDKSGILERQAYNEIPPRVEYRLTAKGQELVEYVIHLLNWMKKWAKISVFLLSIYSV